MTKTATPPVEKEDLAMTSWDQRYATETYVYGTQPNDFLRRVAEYVPDNSRILCLAEGEGRNAVYLAEQGHQVLAVDASRVGLAKAQRLAEQRSVQIESRHVELAEFELGEQAWDVIVSIFVHLPPAVRERLHRQVVAGLRPGGLFILEAYRPEQLAFKTGGPPVVELMMTLKQLQHELDGMHWLHAIELEREVFEGQLHHGMGAVVQLLAKKTTSPHARRQA
jgi:2-polyprenyl-3-methyl-5-hydroxy-6-metoxy-1,4-benzoquinol methylase